HTVDLPASGGTDQPLVVPGALASGFNDAAGSPFWFNGKVPTLPFNAKLFGPSGPHTYDGTTGIDSGIPTGPGATKPLNVKFTRAGTYKFFCDVHYGMVGFVVVKAKHEKIPTARQDSAALTAQVTAAAKSAKQIAGKKEPADTVGLGRAGSGGLELFQMFPTTLTVPSGTAVTFTMSSRTREIHTATFGPKDYLKALAQTYRSPVPSPIGDFPSDPVQPIVLSPTSHGNGFGNVGVLSRDPKTPNPSSRQIRFTQPGTYHFVCLIHPQMQGTIIVK
ncbi:MAG: hypothetical protein M3022_03085, partial [Actinomycetota bacterium]|nr:hypothetical protein [Actinomycetota bacterium]